MPLASRAAGKWTCETRGWVVKRSHVQTQSAPSTEVGQHFRPPDGQNVQTVAWKPVCGGPRHACAWAKMCRILKIFAQMDGFVVPNTIFARTSEIVMILDAGSAFAHPRCTNVRSLRARCAQPPFCDADGDEADSYDDEGDARKIKTCRQVQKHKGAAARG